MAKGTCAFDGCTRGLHRGGRGYCNTHYAQLKRRGWLGPIEQTPPWPERFWIKVQKTDTCWLWTASKQKHGYGTVGLNGGSVLAHRAAYELEVGPIPEGLTLDHLCRVRHCVNPEHLEPVTNAINILRGIGPSAQHARQTKCIRGHEFTEENTYLRTTRRGRQARACLTCMREVLQPRRQALRPQPRVNAEKAQAIYDAAWAGVDRSVIAEQYDIGETAVSNIKHGWSWARVTGHVRAA